MKRLMILFGMLAVAVMLQAQTVVSRVSGSGYVNWTGAASDTVAGATYITKDLFINADGPYLYDFQVDVDTLLVAASDPNFYCGMYGSMDGTNWELIEDSITCYGTADTVFTFDNLSQTKADVNTVAQQVWTGGGVGTDTIGTQADTLLVAAHTETHAITETENAVLWRYLRVKLSGAASVRIELEAIAGGILPKRY